MCIQSFHLTAIFLFIIINLRKKLNMDMKCYSEGCLNDECKNSSSCLPGHSPLKWDTPWSHQCPSHHSSSARSGSKVRDPEMDCPRWRTQTNEDKRTHRHTRVGYCRWDKSISSKDWSVNSSRKLSEVVMHMKQIISDLGTVLRLQPKSERFSECTITKGWS